MNFCTFGVIFVLLAKLKHNLWQHKVEKRSNFCVQTWLIFADLVTIIMM